MCLGIPMRVKSHHGAWALCEGRDGARMVSTALLDPPPAGSWVLVHIDSAQKILTAEEAARIERALDALDLAMAGGDVDHLFADLLAREPQLPPHLRGSGDREDA